MIVNKCVNMLVNLPVDLDENAKRYLLTNIFREILDIIHRLFECDWKNLKLWLKFEKIKNLGQSLLQLKTLAEDW